MTDRPLVLIDVDGVLNPLVRHSPGPGWLERILLVQGSLFLVHLNPAHGPALLSLAAETGAELAWGTTWEEDANLQISPLIGLPELPVAPANSGCHKADGIVPWTRGRPFVWLDDAPEAAEEAGRLAGAQAHLVVAVDPDIGLADRHLALARDWLLARPG